MKDPILVIVTSEVCGRCNMLKMVNKETGKSMLDEIKSWIYPAYVSDVKNIVIKSLTLGELVKEHPGFTIELVPHFPSFLIFSRKEWKSKELPSGRSYKGITDKEMMIAWAKKIVGFIDSNGSSYKEKAEESSLYQSGKTGTGTGKTGTGKTGTGNHPSLSEFLLPADRESFQRESQRYAAETTPKSIPTAGSISLQRKDITFFE